MRWKVVSVIKGEKVQGHARMRARRDFHREEKSGVKIIAMVVVFILSVGVFGLLTHHNTQENAIASVSSSHVLITGEQSRGTAHAPIYINRHEDFQNQASANGWPGNGTEGNPYIIDGYEIDGGAYCIWIENTNVWFVIRNCKLWGATNTGSEPYGRGIYLRNVIHGTLENNTCSGNHCGIYLDDSSNNTIMNNNCSGNGDGIVLDSSGYNTITNNNCSGNAVGIEIGGDSTSNTIRNNNCSGNWAGIYLSYYSSSNIITNNNCSGNQHFGICLDYYSSNNIITSNICSRNSGYSIEAYPYLSNNIITNNNCSDNSEDGISIEYSGNNTITNNTCSGNYHNGMVLGYSGYNTITNNNCSDNSGSGIVLDVSSDNNIRNNNCSDNSQYGIRLYASSNNNIITKNNFYVNMHYAIYIGSGSTGNTIHHNDFYQNNGAGKGVNGNCQAYDSGGGNHWYNNTTQKGNYWSNWDGNGWGTPNAYPIDGSAGASDWYPLLEPVGSSNVSSAPRNLTASAGNANVTLKWEPPADNGGASITNYTIYYGRSSGNYTKKITVGNITTYTVTGLTNGQKYYFAVSAINAVGESEKSIEVSAMPCTVPSAPKNLNAVAGNGNVTLTWAPPIDDGGTSITNYTIYYGTTSGNYTNNITVGNVTKYTIANLTNGQKYYFAVSAINAVGESEKSAEVSAMPCTMPSAPQNLTAVAGNDNVTLTWHPPASDGGSPVTGYKIYYGTSSGNYTTNITVGNVTNYTITNLTNGQKYYFAVSAINGAGEGARSNEVSATPVGEQQHGNTPGFDILAGICAIAVSMAVIAIWQRKKR